MSVTVQHVNADTTFLLAFAPSFQTAKTSRGNPGAFSILLDPWLHGASSILHPVFQISEPTIPPAISSLADIQDEIDLIVISQDKPDHCHRKTLCKLSRDKKIPILATPAAEKIIKSWNYFHEECLHTLPSYDAADEDSVVRIGLPSYTSSSLPGQITITNLPTRFDLTGLHNAIGITYRQPSSVFTRPTYSASQPDLSHSRPSRLRKRSQSDASQKSTGTSRFRSRSRSRPRTSATTKSASAVPNLTSPSTTTLSRATTPNQQQPNTQPISDSVSVIYSPHGLPPSSLKAYTENHLRPLDALPLTLLLHSMYVEQNPWFLGGRVAAGAPGGVEVCKYFDEAVAGMQRRDSLGEGATQSTQGAGTTIPGVKTWISAHDGAKINKGLATIMMKTKKFGPKEAEELLRKSKGSGTVVRGLEVGEKVKLSIEG